MVKYYFEEFDYQEMNESTYKNQFILSCFEYKKQTWSIMDNLTIISLI